MAAGCLIFFFFFFTCSLPLSDEPFRHSSSHVAAGGCVVGEPAEEKLSTENGSFTAANIYQCSRRKPLANNYVLSLHPYVTLGEGGIMDETC